jgi:hypothetical protein
MNDHVSPALDVFGELLVTRVREKAIRDWMKQLDGRMKGETADRLRPDIEELGPGQLALLRRLVPQIVDTTLHHLLWTLEQERSIEVLVSGSSGPESVRSLSDGLPGELYEWIERFGAEE